MSSNIHPQKGSNLRFLLAGLCVLVPVCLLVWGFFSINQAQASAFSPESTLVPNQGNLSVYVTSGGLRYDGAQVFLWDDYVFLQVQVTGAFTPAIFSNLTPGTYHVIAWPAVADIPTLANSQKVTLSLGDTPRNLTLTLQTPNVKGQITDPAGAALPPTYDPSFNLIYPVDLSVKNSSGDDLGFAPTNFDGGYSLALPVGLYSLVAHPRGTLTYTFTKALPQVVNITNTTLPQTFVIPLTYPSVQGYVYDYSQYAGARVHVWSDTSQYQDWFTIYGFGPGAPNPIGAPYQFGGMPAGTYNIQAQAPYYGPSKVFQFTVAPGDQYKQGAYSTIDLYLSLYNFTANLYLPDYYTGVGNVKVRVQNTDRSIVQWKTTSSSGYIEVYNLITGTYQVDFFLPDTLNFAYDPPSPSYTFTLASPYDQVSAYLALKDAVHNKHVTGIVKDNFGKVISDTVVRAYHEGDGQTTSVNVLADGTYDLPLDGGRWRLIVVPNSATANWYFNQADAQWVQFTLDNAKAETATANFIVQTGIFYTVTGFYTDPGYTTFPPVANEIKLCTDEGRCFNNSTYDGNFSLQVPAGTYHLWFWIDQGSGFLPPSDNGKLVVVDGPINLGTMFLQYTSERTVTVAGQIVVEGTTSNYLDSFTLKYHTSSGDWATANTSPGGSYSVSLLPGYWSGGLALTPEQEQSYLVMPPRYRDGYLAAGQNVSNINFRLRLRDAFIQGAIRDGLGNLLPNANVFVYAETCTASECFLVDSTQAEGGFYSLKVSGGISYTVNAWLPEGGFIKGTDLPLKLTPLSGQTINNADIHLQKTATHLYGYLVDSQTGKPVQIEATVYGTDSSGVYWAEDKMWPGNSIYNLYAPTPAVQTLWALKLSVDPATGYVADPQYPKYPVLIQPGQIDVKTVLYVRKLDNAITGIVKIGTTGVPNARVYAKGIKGTATEGLFFEALTNTTGQFSIPVLSGQYVVGAYRLPGQLNDLFEPAPVLWSSLKPDVVQLVFRSRANQPVISGPLSLDPAGSLPGDGIVHIFGLSNAGMVEVTGTLGSSYNLSALANTEWKLWAAYEDNSTRTFYRSDVATVQVGTTNPAPVPLVLRAATLALPGAQCWTFSADQYQVLYLPAPYGLPQPKLEIPAGAMPGYGMVEVCATPSGIVPGGQNLVGYAYDMQARDQWGNLISKDFNRPLRLTYYLPPGTDTRNMLLGFYSASRQEWVSLTNVYVDVSGTFVTGETDHFTKMGVRNGLSEPSEYRLFMPSIQ